MLTAEEYILKFAEVKLIIILPILENIYPQIKPQPNRAQAYPQFSIPKKQAVALITFSKKLLNVEYPKNGIISTQKQSVNIIHRNKEVQNSVTSKFPFLSRGVCSS